MFTYLPGVLIITKQVWNTKKKKKLSSLPFQNLILSIVLLCLARSIEISILLLFETLFSAKAHRGKSADLLAFLLVLILTDFRHVMQDNLKDLK